MHKKHYLLFFFAFSHCKHMYALWRGINPVFPPAFFFKISLITLMSEWYGWRLKEKEKKSNYKREIERKKRNVTPALLTLKYSWRVNKSLNCITSVAVLIRQCGSINSSCCNLSSFFHSAEWCFFCFLSCRTKRYISMLYSVWQYSHSAFIDSTCRIGINKAVKS